MPKGHPIICEDERELGSDVEFLMSASMRKWRSLGQYSGFSAFSVNTWITFPSSTCNYTWACFPLL